MVSTKLSGKDIVEIIKACGESGVGRLSYAGLTVAFGDFAKEEKIEVPTDISQARIHAMNLQLEKEQQPKPSVPDDPSEWVVTDPLRWERHELGIEEVADEAV